MLLLTYQDPAQILVDFRMYQPQIDGLPQVQCCRVEGLRLLAIEQPQLKVGFGQRIITLDGNLEIGLSFVRLFQPEVGHSLEVISDRGIFLQLLSPPGEAQGFFILLLSHVKQTQMSHGRSRPGIGLQESFHHLDGVHVLLTVIEERGKSHDAVGT